MEKEFKNLLLTCKNPLAALKTLFFFTDKAIQKFRRGFKIKNCYPPNVKIALKKYKSIDKTFEKIKPEPSSPFTSGKLKLAAGYLDYQGEPDWRRVFKDDEQTESLHRWHWLLYELTETKKDQSHSTHYGTAEVSFDWGVNLMRSWLKQMTSQPTGLAGTSYTISERIANACLFTALLREQTKQKLELPADLKTALKQMADYLVERLEYHKPKTTCNHIINNSRALFFVGHELNLPELTELALTILQNDLKRLVSVDGFLKNGSSHYHVLFTRWLLEMLWLAKKTNHEELISLIEPLANKLAERCCFFLVQNQTTNQWQMPLIGDISPDCAPDWLIFYLQKYFNLTGRPAFDNFYAFEKSCWYRLDLNAFTIFWHVEPALKEDNGAHSHNDLGSFVVYYKGLPALIDIGRLNYDESQSIGAQAHNSLTIGQLEPILTRQYSRYPYFYRRAKVKTSWQKNGNKFTFTIKHKGFKRLASDNIFHERKFIIKGKNIKIIDLLNGRKKHAVKTFFHLPVNSNLSISRREKGFKIKESGWHPAYGAAKKAKTMIFSDQVKLPFTAKYVLCAESLEL